MKNHRALTASVLAIDIGNTSTSLGLFSGNRIHHVERIAKTDQSRAAIASIITTMAAAYPVTGAAIASVVPALTNRWSRAVKHATGLESLVINHTVRLGVPVTYPHPETIGADRLANAVGAAERYGTPVIVADFGTAVTFDVVTRKQGYVGGVIAPGLPLMFDYLAERTALLPHIAWAPIRKRIGKNTGEAMQLGAHWGYRGMVREILHELTRSRELHGATICATGGFAGRVLRGIAPAPRIDPTLTLFGIGRIYEQNTP